MFSFEAASGCFSFHLTTSWRYCSFAFRLSIKNTSFSLANISFHFSPNFFVRSITDEAFTISVFFCTKSRKEDGGFFGYPRSSCLAFASCRNFGPCNFSRRTRLSVFSPFHKFMTSRLYSSFKTSCLCFNCTFSALERVFHFMDKCVKISVGFFPEATSPWTLE